MKPRKEKNIAHFANDTLDGVPQNIPIRLNSPKESKIQIPIDDYLARLRLAQADPSAPHLTQQNVACRWHCSTMTVRRMMRRGELRYTIRGARHVLFALADLLRIEAASRVELPKEN